MNKRSELVKLRKERGFTQKQMAELLNVNRSCYANYENGYRNPSFELVLQLKEILDVKDDKFFLKDYDTISVFKGGMYQ